MDTGRYSIGMEDFKYYSQRKQLKHDWIKLVLMSWLNELDIYMVAL